MNDETRETDPWIIPLHGVEAPGQAASAPATEPPRFFDFDDDELPTIEFRPRLRRSA